MKYTAAILRTMAAQLAAATGKDIFVERADPRSPGHNLMERTDKDRSSQSQIIHGTTAEVGYYLRAALDFQMTQPRYLVFHSSADGSAISPFDTPQEIITYFHDLFYPTLSAPHIPKKSIGALIGASGNVLNFPMLLHHIAEIQPGQENGALYTHNTTRTDHYTVFIQRVK